MFFCEVDVLLTTLCFAHKDNYSDDSQALDQICISRRPSLVYFWKSPANFADQILCRLYLALLTARVVLKNEKTSSCSQDQPSAQSVWGVIRFKFQRTWSRGTEQAARPNLPWENTGSKGAQDSNESSPGTFNHEPECSKNTAKYVDKSMYMHIYTLY